MLAYGIITFNRGAPTWAIASLVLFAAPLALQWSRWVMVRTYALWFAAFLVLQALLTPWLRGDFITLPRQMNSTIDVRAADLPGMPPGIRHVTTDEKGFRANPRVDYRAKHALRIYAIGGSTTEDILLDDESTWTHLVQENIVKQGKSAEIVNTGVSGCAPQIISPRSRSLHGSSPTWLSSSSVRTTGPSTSRIALSAILGSPCRYVIARWAWCWTAR